MKIKVLVGFDELAQQAMIPEGATVELWIEDIHGFYKIVTKRSWGMRRVMLKKIDKVSRQEIETVGDLEVS